jgi:hypothetical protein
MEARIGKAPTDALPRPAEIANFLGRVVGDKRAAKLLSMDKAKAVKELSKKFASDRGRACEGHDDLAVSAAPYGRRFHPA